jgi:xanthine/uracil permease
LIPVGIKYAAGGAADFQMAADSFGSLKHWFVALTVIVIALVMTFSTKGILSNAEILAGLLAGYVLAFALGMVSFAAAVKASWIIGLQVMPSGFEFSLGAVIAVTLMSIVSAVEAVGDTSATTKAGAN